jgi:hypothetical protein
LVKRYSELFSLEAGNKTFAPGRGYQVVDLETLAQFGVASGYAAALVLALYIDSTAVGSLYRMPQALWLACPPLLYWISRVWLLARRGEVLEDPLLFAVSDRQSRWLVVVLAGIVWAAV